MAGQLVPIRNPHAVRPWQHVLEPLAGYLLLAQKLYDDGPRYAEGWNFGPDDADAQPVSWIASRLATYWGGGAEWVLDGANHPHEAHYLKLDWSKARAELGWFPCWNLEESLKRCVDWYKADQLHTGSQNAREATLADIRAFEDAHTSAL
jgi:CDP-glucose 4,6-dehydratase